MPPRIPAARHNVREPQKSVLQRRLRRLSQVPAEILFHAFTPADMCLMELSNKNYREPDYERTLRKFTLPHVARKLQLCLRKQEGAENSDLVIKTLRTLSRLPSQVGKLDVQWSVDITTGGHLYGMSEEHRVFLDAPLGIFLYRDKEPFMALSLNVSSARGGMLVLEQIQSLKAQGNRDLFKFGSPYAEAVCSWLQEACGKELSFARATAARVAKNAARGYQNTLRELDGMETNWAAWEPTDRKEKLQRKKDVDELQQERQDVEKRLQDLSTVIAGRLEKVYDTAGGTLEGDLWIVSERQPDELPLPPVSALKNLAPGVCPQI